jgi:hypothetical protein
MKKTLLLSVLISALALSVFAARGGGRSGGGGAGRGGNFRGAEGGGRFDQGRGAERIDGQGVRANDRDRDFRGRDETIDRRDGYLNNDDAGPRNWGAFGAGLGLGVIAANFYPYHLHLNDGITGWTYSTTPYGNYTIYTWSNPNYGSSSYYEDANGNVYVYEPSTRKWVIVGDPSGIIPNH